MKNDLTRCFVAIEIPDQIKSKLEEIQDTFRSKIRRVTWTKTENIHLTLKFIGEIENHRITEIGSIIRKVALSQKPFSIEIGGMGTFPNMSRPRVLWIGIKQGSRVVSKLANQINLELVNLGLPMDRRFHPHLTLGRLKEQVNLSAFINSFKEYETLDESTLTVETISLIKSELLPKGAVYTPIETYTLNKEKANNGK